VLCLSDEVCRCEQEFAAFTEEIEDTLEALDKLEDAEIKEMVETRDKDERMETQDMLSKVIRPALAHTHAPETMSHVQTPLLPKQSSCQSYAARPEWH
jgi:hypothetical protein